MKPYFSKPNNKVVYFVDKTESNRTTNMKSDLEETIEAYETEKAQLEKRIAEYVDEADYFFAHQHQRALKKLNKTLYILKSLKDPNYGQILFGEDSLRFIEKMKSDSTLPEFARFLLDSQIAEQKNKLLKLQNETFSPYFDSQEIDDVLFDLVNNTIKSFRLYFKSTPEMFVSFSMAGPTIEIKLSNEKMSHYIEDKIFRDFNQLKSLGFELRNEEWTFQYTNHFKDALDIKILLSRLIYEVFNYDKRYDSAKIVINNR